MSQDVLAHSWLEIGPIHQNRQISQSVDGTSDKNGRDRMDRDIYRLWKISLGRIYRNSPLTALFPSTEIICRLLRRSVKGTFGLTTADRLFGPDPDEWHRAMRRIMRIAESGDRLVPFARHVAAGKGLVYPKDPESHYIRGLEAPGDAAWDFEQVFEKTMGNLLEFWKALSLSLAGRPSPLDTMAGWDLGTGFDENGCLLFWR